MKIAVIPGSFDPVTMGHVDLAMRTAKLFDRVYVVAMINDMKEYAFTIEEREQMLSQALSGIDNVVVESFGGMLVDYVEKVSACAIVKGIRNEKDAEYELNMAKINKDGAPNVETLLLCSQNRLLQVSSGKIKQMVMENEDISALVPGCVLKYFGMTNT